MPQILVIDDESELRENIADLLDYEGYQVIAAESGWQGIEAAKATMPDIILCDIQMPDLDGYAVLKELQAEPRTQMIPFIFLTAKTGKEALRMGMNLGADDYLTKPFDRDDLLSAIHSRVLRSTGLFDAYQRKAQNEMERFIYRISSELETPIANMKSAKSLLVQVLGNKLPSDLSKVFGTYQEGTESLQRIVDQILLQVKLDAESINAAEMMAKCQEISLAELVKCAVDLGRKFACKRKHIDLRLSLKDNNAVLYGCSTWLKHALAEIIANALDFSDENRSVVIKQWIKGENISILVMNEGTCIPSQELNLILQPFRKASKDEARRKGLGLGLGIAKQVIELHAGRLRISSSDTGTSVLIQLPLHELPESQEILTEAETKIDLF